MKELNDFLLENVVFNRKQIRFFGRFCKDYPIACEIVQRLREEIKRDLKTIVENKRRK